MCVPHSLIQLCLGCDRFSILRENPYEEVDDDDDDDDENDYY